jgi:hypothetical protein
MQCLACHEPHPAGRRPDAAIAVFVAGDEVIFSYWRCAACGAFSVEAWHDRFLGDADAHWIGPVAPALGERCLALVAACPSPQDKLCGCPSHRALYTGLPG